MSKSAVTTMVATALSWQLAIGVAAENLTAHSTQVIIQDDVGRDVHGVIGVNMAAGDANLQSNATAFSLGGEQAMAQVTVVQVLDNEEFSFPDLAVTRIEGGAFSNATGAVGINQAAGAANAQANSVAIAIGVEVTADAELAQSVSGLVMPVVMNGQQLEASIAPEAFAGASGIVQVNQSAGVGNATGNSFALRIHLD